MCPSVAIGPPLLKHRNPILCHRAVKWGCVSVLVCVFWCVAACVIGVCLHVHRVNPYVPLFILSQCLIDIFCLIELNDNESESGPVWPLPLFDCFHNKMSADLTGVRFRNRNREKPKSPLIQALFCPSLPFSLYFCPRLFAVYLNPSISLLPPVISSHLTCPVASWSPTSPLCDRIRRCDQDMIKTHAHTGLAFTREL